MDKMDRRDGHIVYVAAAIYLGVSLTGIAYTLLADRPFQSGVVVALAIVIHGLFWRTFHAWLWTSDVRAHPKSYLANVQGRTEEALFFGAIMAFPFLGLRLPLSGALKWVMAFACLVAFNFALTSLMARIWQRET